MRAPVDAGGSSTGWHPPSKAFRPLTISCVGEPYMAAQPAKIPSSHALVIAASFRKERGPCSAWSACTARRSSCARTKDMDSSAWPSWSGSPAQALPQRSTIPASPGKTAPTRALTAPSGPRASPSNGSARAARPASSSTTWHHHDLEVRAHSRLQYLTRQGSNIHSATTCNPPSSRSVCHDKTRNVAPVPAQGRRFVRVHSGRP